ncbi:MAG: transcriptional repressor [Deltaproteobacteria bacterium]|jgi:Fur family peroxide stress response transcriptional regulator|nr:transcriptional repressor [Deltaproteobacteria bacterium]
MVHPLVKQMRAAGHRMTPQRQAVLEILTTSDSHPTVDQIYERVRIDFPMTSRATVYKTISLAKEMGAVMELEFSKGSNRYDGKRPYPHTHVICMKCKQVMDADDLDTTALKQEIVRNTGYRIDNHRIDFFGVCPDCQKESTHN